MSRKERAAHVVVTAVGALSGLAWVWLHRTREPEPQEVGRFLLMHPNYATPTSAWEYAAVALVCGLTALFVSLVVAVGKDDARRLRDSDSR